MADSLVAGKAVAGHGLYFPAPTVFFRGGVNIFGLLSQRPGLSRCPLAGRLVL